MSALKDPWVVVSYCPQAKLFFFFSPRQTFNTLWAENASFPFFLLALLKHCKITTGLGHSPSYCRTAPLLSILSHLPHICSFDPIFQQISGIVWTARTLLHKHSVNPSWWSELQHTDFSWEGTRRGKSRVVSLFKLRKKSTPWAVNLLICCRGGGQTGFF